MKILFISDNFPPEVNAPASRTYEHCVQWARAGHDVTIVTCAPNFPAGKLFEGYRNRLRQVEQIDGLRVVRVWSYISANEGFALRVLDYLSFMVSAVIASMFERRPDVVIGTSPQFFAACGAWMVSRLRRRPFVFELRDLWPESIKAVGAMKDSWAIRLLERLEMYLYRQAALIVAVTHGFKSTLTGRGIDSAKVKVVTNGADLSRFQPRPRDEALVDALGLRGKFVVGYIGTHGMAHGLATLLEAAALLQAHPIGHDCRILLVGDGAQKRRLIERARSMRLDNVVFVDPVPKDQVARYWSVLDVSVLHLLDKALFSTVIPSKLFESVAMGVPVLSAVPGETRALVERMGVGQHFTAEDAHDLARCVTKLRIAPALMATMKSSCAPAARNYDRRVLARDMLDALEHVAATDSR